MIQKFYTHNNPYQIPSSPSSQQQHRIKATSPKLQGSKSSCFQNKNNEAEYNKNIYRPTQQTYNQQQSSQQYSPYYGNKPMNPNSFSHQSSYPSKHSRTQNSKQKLNLIAQNHQQKQHPLKIPHQQYTQRNYPQNSISQNEQRTNNLLSQLKQNQKLISKQSTSRPHCHLKTQTSKTKFQKYDNSQTKIKQNFKKTNQQDKKSFNGSSNMQNSKTQNNSYSPFQQYYTNRQQQSNSRTPIQMSGRLPNHRRMNSGSRDTSTVNTQNRPSSLSLNKFHKKPMLTFYHCQLKKFYSYNDEGYLTNKQYILRQKIQQKALQAFDRVFQSQATMPKTRKSKSLAQFPRINSLKQQAQKQRKKNQEIYGKFQQVKQKYNTQTKMKQTLQNPPEKPYSPSQLPPTSTLSKRKFNVIYKENDNQNLLGKLSINDDSYHEREEKRIQSQFTENHKKGKTNGQNSESEISSRQSVCRPMDKRSESEFIYNTQGEQINQSSQLPKGDLGNVSKSRESFSQDISEQSRSYYSSQKSEKIPSQLSQNSRYSQNKSRRPIQKSYNEGKSQRSQKSENEGSLKNQSKLNDQSELGLKSKQSISQGNQDKSGMINSKKSVKVQNKSNLSLSKGSLKMLSNSEKKKNSKIQNKSAVANLNQEKQQKVSKHSLSSSQLGFQSKISIKKNTKSVNPKALQLKKQSKMKEKEEQQKLSEYAMDLSIRSDFKRKPSLKQQYNHYLVKTQQIKTEQSFLVNMNKKPSVQVQKIVSKFENSQHQNNNQSQLRLSSKHSIKSSVKSQYLQLDSALRLPKSLRISQQKVDISQKKIHTSIQHQNSSQSQEELLLNSQSSKVKQKKSKHSQSQLLAESKHSLKMHSKISENVKNSQINDQKQLQRSKALTHRSNRSSRTENKVKISIYPTKQNRNKMKYGNFLTVNQGGGTQIDNSNFTQKKQNSNSNVSKQNSRRLSDKNKISLSKFDKSEQKSNLRSNYLEQSMAEFNFIERVDQLLNIEEDLHENRRKVQQEHSITEQFQDVIAKIQGHLYLLREILEVAVSAIQMYSEDSTWVFRSCIFALKKYHLQRNKIVDSLRGKKSCFNIAEYELVKQDLKQFLTHPVLKLLSKDLQHCNQLLQTFIEEFISFLHQHQLSSLNEITSKPFDDRFDLGILLQEFRTEILGLKDKKTQQRQRQQQFEQETQEVINKRIFKLMEVTFLLSELTGKRIKQFTEQIDYVNDFQQYLEEYWPYFQRIVKTFA